MFKVGDIVLFIDDNINRETDVDINKSYTIDWISSDNGIIRDIFLIEYKNIPFYHKRFELDVAQNRIRKISKLKERIYERTKI
jgi:hypothetical protein